MSIFENCILASDIDGTLMEESEISDRNVKAIKEFVCQDGIFALATGRCFAAVKHIFKVFDKSLVGPCILLNGGMIYDFSCDKILFESRLDETSKTFAKEILENFNEIGIEVYSGMDVFLLRRTEETEIHGNYEELNAKEVTFDKIKDTVWNKVLYMCNDEETRDRFIDYFEALDTEKRCSFVKTKIMIYGEYRYYIEQITAGTSKASGLRKLCELLNTNGDSFAIGDNYNDIEMLEAADISASPSDGVDEVLKIANFVGGRCRDGAVADFIEYLFNKPEVKNGPAKD